MKVSSSAHVYHSKNYPNMENMEFELLFKQSFRIANKISLGGEFMSGLNLYGQVGDATLIHKRMMQRFDLYWFAVCFTTVRPPQACVKDSIGWT